jgi:hypothetical protein
MKKTPVEQLRETMVGLAKKDSDVKALLGLFDEAIAGIKKFRTPLHLKKSDIDWGVASFCGPLKNKLTGEPKLCDMCNKEKAMWAHRRKKGAGQAYLCFGCGDH